jgi:hypothetical protein
VDRLIAKYGPDHYLVRLRRLADELQARYPKPATRPKLTLIRGGRDA